MNGEKVIKRYKIEELFKGIPMISKQGYKNVLSPCEVLALYSMDGVYTTSNRRIDNNLSTGQYLIRRSNNAPFVFSYKINYKIIEQPIIYEIIDEKLKYGQWKIFTINEDNIFMVIEKFKYIKEEICNCVLKPYEKNEECNCELEQYKKDKTCNCEPYEGINKIYTSGGYLDKYLKYKRKYLMLKNNYFSNYIN